MSSEPRQGSKAEAYKPTEGFLVVDELTKQFGGLTAVKDLSFAVKEGEILGLIGPNGAGKSTTFNCITGNLTPTSGTIWFDGEEITGKSPSSLVQRGIAHIHQSFNVLEEKTVLQNVELGLLSNSIRQELFSAAVRTQRRQKATEICERVGLGDQLNRMPSELPHRDLVALELARALSTDPDILLIDEPFAGLSRQEVADIAELLEELRDEGLTLVIIDHNMQDLLSLIDNVVVMNFGEKLAEGTPETIKNDPEVQEAYLGKEDDTAWRETGDTRETTVGEQLLTVDDVRVSYDTLEALTDIDLHVDEGEIVSVIGPNGAGKSTLSHSIAGLKSYEGSITYRGMEVRDQGTDSLVEDGLIYCTESEDLFGFMTVKDNLTMGAYRAQAEQAERLEFVYDLFPRLEERTNQNARSLSGGEQQMLAIGRALMSDPNLLILDEPTLGLAPVIIDNISDAIEEINDAGVTVLLCEQNVTFAMRHSDRIYLLENGTVVREGDPETFMASEYIRETYLGR